MANLTLPDGYRTQVWRLLKAAIQSDPAYDAAGVSLEFFDGTSPSVPDVDSYLAGLQFLPVAAVASWYDEGSTVAVLNVQVQARLPTLDVEDVFNLQEAMESSLNSLGSTSFQADLVAAGALTGLVLFNRPLAPVPGKPPGNDTGFRLAGQFSVEVLRPLNP